MNILYKSGYKYQLADNYAERLSIPSVIIAINTDYLKLQGQTLTVKTGYAWDGASGVAVDTKTIMRASLVHDALYQLMRMELLPPSYRLEVDNLFIQMCKEDGMSWLRRKYIYTAVRFFGKKFIRPSHSKSVNTAP